MIVEVVAAVVVVVAAAAASVEQPVVILLLVVQVITIVAVVAVVNMILSQYSKVLQVLKYREIKIRVQNMKFEEAFKNPDDYTITQP